VESSTAYSVAESMLDLTFISQLHTNCYAFDTSLFEVPNQYKILTALYFRLLIAQ